MKDVVLSLNHENVDESVIDNDIEELFDFVQQLTRIVTPADEKKDHFAVYQRMTLEELDTKHHGVGFLVEFERGRCLSLVSSVSISS